MQNAEKGYLSSNNARGGYHFCKTSNKLQDENNSKLLLFRESPIMKFKTKNVISWERAIEIVCGNLKNKIQKRCI